MEETEGLLTVFTSARRRHRQTYKPLLVALRSGNCFPIWSLLSWLTLNKLHKAGVSVAIFIHLSTIRQRQGGSLVPGFRKFSSSWWRDHDRAVYSVGDKRQRMGGKVLGYLSFIPSLAPEYGMVWLPFRCVFPLQSILSGNPSQMPLQFS